MGPDDIYPLIRKSIVLIGINADILSSGIIVAAKAQSAYVIADAHGFTQGCGITVEFHDNVTVGPMDTKCYTHDGLLGIHCLSGIAFDQNLVKKFDILEEDADLCEEVYVYDEAEESIVEGYAMKVDQYHYNLTNIATLHSHYGSPVVKKDDGKLIGMCSSFEHHLTARNTISIASSIERSHGRIFTTVADTLSYLDTII